MKIKYCTLLICICLWSSLVGCNEVKELTEEETAIIAEYAADLLLKYDLSYDDRLVDGEEKLEKKEEREQEFPTTAPVTEEQISEEATTEVKAQVQEDVPEQAENSGETEKAVSDGFSGDIADLLGRSDISITYKDYVISQQYPATDEEGKFIYLEASEGYQLFVVRFKVSATTENAADISLIDENIDYKIVCNDSKAAKPMLTILMEDLGTLETTVKPGEEQEAVLVFQISDEMKDSLNNVKLFIQYNEIEHIIELL